MNNINIIKQKETYLVVNKVASIGYYTITKKGCNTDNELVVQGNIEGNASFLFIPTTDGDYTVTLTIVSEAGEEEVSTVLITHYPTLIKSVVAGIEVLLCGDNCGCEPTACTNKGLEYQNLFGELMLLTNILKSVNTCNNNTHAIQMAISDGVIAYKCELYLFFCRTQLESKITGKTTFNKKMVDKIIGIIYLMLYYYEKEITSTQKEYQDFLNKKYEFLTIKQCVLRAEVDVLLVEQIFTETFYAGCTDGPIICTTDCFQPVTAAETFLFEYDINTQLNTIIGTVVLKNTCNTPQLFATTVIYKDPIFRLIAKAQTGENPVFVGPGEDIALNIIAIGTKPVHTLLIMPFLYEGTLINTYHVLFKDTVVIPNSPPVITNIFKELSSRDPYTFTVNDFESHFTDIDGDAMDKVVLVGDTSRYTLNNIPYTSGTIITRSNITNLVYTPIPGDNAYDAVLNWLAYDSKGNVSN